MQIGRSLDEVDSVLDDLRRRTLILVIAVSLAAALAGWLIAGTVAAPMSRLTKAAEEVGSSGRLDVAVPGTGTDEVGRLGGAFRYMLGALATSRAEQQRLVQDAGHELRTPLTSLKTNLSVLRRHPEMASDMRDGVLDDLDSEITELTELVNELVAVASGDLEAQPNERIDLQALAADVAERVGRRRSRDIVLEARSSAVVDAPRSALDRAVTNLIDNACKFDETAGPIDIVVDGGSLTVLDHGPGIPEGEEQRIFDRFHRAESARSMPGSGLGLSIVRDVVERAGGTVSATNRDGGGAAIGFTSRRHPSGHRLQACDEIQRSTCRAGVSSLVVDLAWARRLALLDAEACGDCSGSELVELGDIEAHDEVRLGLDDAPDAVSRGTSRSCGR